MKIFIERTKEAKELDFQGTAKDLLLQLGLLVEDVLIVSNGKLVTEEEELKNDDEIRILSVISGG